MLYPRGKAVFLRGEKASLKNNKYKEKKSWKKAQWFKSTKVNSALGLKQYTAYYFDVLSLLKTKDSMSYKKQYPSPFDKIKMIYALQGRNCLWDFLPHTKTS